MSKHYNHLSSINVDNRPNSKSWLLPVLMTFAIVLSACSASTSSKAPVSKKSQNTTVNAFLKTAEGPLKWVAPGPPIKISTLRGDTVVTVDCAPFAAPPLQTTQGAQEAASVAGLNMKLISGGADNLTQDIGFLDEAIALHPKAIITIGCENDLLTVQMKAAHAAGIPVVVSDYANPDAHAVGQGAGPYAFGVAGQSPTLEAKQVAAYIAANGPSNAKIAEITANSLLGSSGLTTAFKSALPSYCSNCSIVASTNVDPSLWSTNLTQAATNLIQANKGLNYIFPLFDGMAPYTAAAIRALGTSDKVKVVTTQASVGEALASVKSGAFAIDSGSSNLWVGWAAVDQAMRAMLKLPPESNVTIPARLFTTSTMATLNPNSQTQLFGTSFVSGFKSLWGV